MTFREAKQIIRKALAEAGDGKLMELLEAARAGRVPWVDQDYCLATRIYGASAYLCSESGEMPSRTCVAYLVIAPGGNDRRQRVLVAMVRAEMRRRVQRTLAEAETVTEMEVG